MRFEILKKKGFFYLRIHRARIFAALLCLLALIFKFFFNIDTLKIQFTNTCLNRHVVKWHQMFHL